MPLKKSLLAVVGVGNTLAGDDGAGVHVIRRLRDIRGNDPGVLLHTLEGDHFEIADLIGQAERFIFVDAVEGERPGELVSMVKARRAFSPSFHQTDISSVMNSLEAIGIADPFPPWELWGITILSPSEFGEGLSPEVLEAVGRLSRRICREIEETVMGRRSNFF